MALLLVANRLDHRSQVGPPAEGADSASSYVFLHVQADGITPVTYSSCVPINIEVNTRTMPPEADGLVDEAVATMAGLTGLELVVVGETSRSPSQRYDTWAPLLVAWSDPEEHTALEGEVVGTGGSTHRGRGVADAIRVYLSGQVTLDGPAIAALLATRPDGREQARGIILHELGHVLGLDHVDDPSQLMHHDNYGVVEPQSGDRAGLARLGRGPCIPTL